jgi:hypothetical protein
LVSVMVFGMDPPPPRVKRVQSLQTRRHESGLVGQVFRV